MLYLSLALVAVAAIFTLRPPSFTIHRTYEVIQPPTPPQTQEEIKEPDHPSSTYDEITQAFNSIFHNLGGHDDE